MDVILAEFDSIAQDWTEDAYLWEITFFLDENYSDIYLAYLSPTLKNGICLKFFDENGNVDSKPIGVGKNHIATPPLKNIWTLILMKH